MPREQDYVPVNPPLAEGEAPYPPVTAASILKLGDNSREGRRRKIDKQYKNERSIYSLMWAKMSIASQKKVAEEAGFREVHVNLDSVRLWEFIRSTHFTHTYTVKGCTWQMLTEWNRLHGSLSSDKVSVKISMSSNFDTTTKL